MKSMSQRKGSLLWFIPKAQFHLLTPDANASTYLFNNHVIVRCLEGVDAESFPVKHFDGASL